MDPVTMALISGGLAFGQSYLGGRKQKQQRRRYGRRLQRALSATEAIQGRSLSQQEALSRQATKQQVGGYDAARREASRLGRGAKRSALDRETQLLGRASQGLTQSGLGSTTVGTNLQRGIASDTNRLMADVDENLAGVYGNLALGRAGAEAAGTQQLGQFAGQRGDLMSQLAQMGTMRDLYGASPWGGGGPMPDREGNIAQNLLTGAQTGLGTFMGMGGGGGGDAMGGIDPEMLKYLFDLNSQGGGQAPWQSMGQRSAYGGGYA